MGNYLFPFSSMWILQGLSDEVVTHRLIRDGPNQLPAKKQTPLWLLWVKEMTTGFSLLLWLGGILSILAYGVQLSLQPNTTTTDNVSTRQHACMQLAHSLLKAFSPPSNSKWNHENSIWFGMFILIVVDSKSIQFILIFQQSDYVCDF